MASHASPVLLNGAKDGDGSTEELRGELFPRQGKKRTVELTVPLLDITDSVNGCHVPRIPDFRGAERISPLINSSRNDADSDSGEDLVIVRRPRISYLSPEGSGDIRQSPRSSPLPYLRRMYQNAYSG
jgi:hypothetical protein